MKLKRLRCDEYFEGRRIRRGTGGAYHRQPSAGNVGYAALGGVLLLILVGWLLVAYWRTVLVIGIIGAVVCIAVVFLRRGA